MSASAEKLQTARANFQTHQSLASAAMFFSILRECEEDGAIGDDEWLDGCADIETFLWRVSAA